MAGFENDVLYAQNVDFRGVDPVAGQVTADGQLLIGATASPYIRVSTLTAGSGISITNGAGSITIAATGGGSSVPNLTYITSTTASGGPVNFTGLSNTYVGYRFYYVDLTPSASDKLIVRLSTDNGSTYDSGAHYSMSGDFSLGNGASSDLTAFPLRQNPGSTDSTSGQSGYLDVYYVGETNGIVTFKSIFSWVDGTSQNPGIAEGIYQVKGSVDAIRFTVAGANNIASGTIHQYGIS